MNNITSELNILMLAFLMSKDVNGRKLIAGPVKNLATDGYCNNIGGLLLMFVNGIILEADYNKLRNTIVEFMVAEALESKEL